VVLRGGGGGYGWSDGSVAGLVELGGVGIDE
jgi:hypothetical protein